jgi:glycosyltransferase involved in cell wall biosynthesis
MKLSYVLPVHNNERTLGATVGRVVDRLAERPHSEILLVENGSKDYSWERCRELEGEKEGVVVRAYREAEAGIGWAYARGLRELETLHGPDPDRCAVLSASDLPFGFTDLESALPIVEADRAPIAIGSKAHAASRAGRGWKRGAMTTMFRGLRRALTGTRVGDSQGSFFIRLDVACSLAPDVRSRDFFYTTELVFRAEQRGLSVVEAPIALEASQLDPTTSTVRAWRHGGQMLAHLVTLRLRDRA